MMTSGKATSLTMQSPAEADVLLASALWGVKQEAEKLSSQLARALHWYRRDQGLNIVIISQSRGELCKGKKISFVPSYESS